MVKLHDLTNYLNQLLNIQDFKDYGPQGLQVEGKTNINKVVTGVSASVQLFEEAVDIGADLILVHHGILWDKESHVVKGGFKRRLLTLLTNDVSLLAYHLPLDKHPELGNNAIAAKKMGLTNIQEFGDVGVKGTVANITVDNLLQKVQNVYKSDSLIFSYGPNSIQNIGICSGGAERDITLAIDEGLDAYITGEVSEPIMHLAKEGCIHFIAAGHYATEKPGIQALGDHIAEEFNLKVQFIDVPNPV